EAAEARREVDQANGAARAFDDGLEDGGIGQVPLAAFLGAGDFRLHEAARGLGAAQQGVEDRIAVEPAEAMPNVAAQTIDQARDRAVADDAELEGAHAAVPGGAVWFPRCSVPCVSQARTLAGSPPNTSATRKPIPPNLRAMLMPASSVKSSPMKIGRRPWNGACAISRSTASPLDAARRPSSTASRAGIRRNQGWSAGTRLRTSSHTSASRSGARR